MSFWSLCGIKPCEPQQTLPSSVDLFLWYADWYGSLVMESLMWAMTNLSRHFMGIGVRATGIASLIVTEDLNCGTFGNWDDGGCLQ